MSRVSFANPSFTSLHLSHSSFSNTSDITSPHHRLFTCITWRAAHGPEMVWLVRREWACVEVEREYVGIMQCSFSLVMVVVIAQHEDKMTALILSPTNCKIRVVISFLGELTREFRNCEVPVLQNCLLHTFQYHQGWSATMVFMLVRPSVNFPHDRLIILLGPYTWHNWQWISAEDCFWACRNLTSDNQINLTVGGRQYQCSHFLLVLCNNYYCHKTETALNYSHILPLYCYACTFLSD